MDRCEPPQIYDPETESCIEFQDCGTGQMWHPYMNKCVSRASTRSNPTIKRLARLEAQYWQGQTKLAHVDQWFRKLHTRTEKMRAESEEYRTFTKKPGEPGFNKEASQLLTAYLSKSENSIVCTGPRRPQPYQRTVEFLFHPDSPVDRMAVLHRTGSGKTLTMIMCLSNYFNDSRPKLAIFPNDAVRDNFYAELMAWDNPFRDYVFSKDQTISFERAEKRQLTKEELTRCEDILAMKNRLRMAGKEGYLAAPLRAFSYRQMGGKSVEAMGFLKQVMPGDVKCGPVSGRVNLLCNKVIVMDEAHNLIKPDTAKITNPISLTNLAHLKESLYMAENTAMALFTATPVQTEPREADDLLRVVKGTDYARLNDEGFVSTYYASPPSAYPRSSPSERSIPNIVTVELAGDPNKKTTALGNYLSKLLKGPKAGYKIDAKFLKSSTRDIYEYTSAYTSSQTQAAFMKSLRTQPQIVAPKLYACAKMIQEAKGKVIVLTRRRHGFFPLGQMIETCPEFSDIAHGRVQSLLGSKETTRRDFQTFECDGKAMRGSTLTECVKKNFNDVSNAMGDHIKCLILNADEFSEGIDFKSVRTNIFLDVPTQWGEALQRKGRTSRHCSAQQLPEELRTVDTYMIVAQLPHYVRMGTRSKETVVDLRDVLTVDEELVINLINARDAIEDKMCQLVNLSMDLDALTPFTGQSHCKTVHPMSEDMTEEEMIALQKSMDERERRVIDCKTTFDKCLASGQRVLKGAYPDGIPHAEGIRMNQACVENRDACVDKIIRSYPVNPSAPNCPPGYNIEQCQTFCDSMGLAGDDHVRCMTRRNQRKPTVNCPEGYSDDECVKYCEAQEFDSEDKVNMCRDRTNVFEGGMDLEASVVYPALPTCDDCPEGQDDAQCMMYCKDQGYVDVDLYNCVARKHRGSACRLPPTGAPVKPEVVVREIERQSAMPRGSDMSDKVSYNEHGRSPGRLITRGGQVHRRGCEANPPHFDDCDGVKKPRRKTPRRK